MYSSKIDTIKKNAEVIIITDMNGWSYVQTDTMSGWIRSDVITGKKASTTANNTSTSNTTGNTDNTNSTNNANNASSNKSNTTNSDKTTAMIIKVILIQVNNILKKQCILMIHT